MKESITYDAMGQRIAKTVTNKNVTMGDKFVTTYYVRDPQGNVLAVYEHQHGDSDNGTFTLAEQHLYGASRLGMRKMTWRKAFILRSIDYMMRDWDDDRV